MFITKRKIILLASLGFWNDCVILYVHYSTLHYQNICLFKCFLFFTPTKWVPIYIIRFFIHTPFWGLYLKQCYKIDIKELSSREIKKIMKNLTFFFMLIISIFSQPYLCCDGHTGIGTMTISSATCSSLSPTQFNCQFNANWINQG